MASMTRQHFVALADSLRVSKPRYKRIRKQGVKLAVWEQCVRQVAYTCKTFNNSFDYDKFYRACGMED